jgi:hypothetical protein
MRTKTIGLLGVTLLAHVLWFGAPPAAAQSALAKDPYPTMAPLDQYLIADEKAEIALARTAAPPSISDDAEIMVLGTDGYKTVVAGKNGFMCLVERGWGAPTDNPNFWSPKLRAPHWFNAAATRTFVPIFLLKTKLVLAGKSKAEILAATDAAFAKKELPALEPGAMCYMMSKQQYLNDQAKNWHPHLMFFAAGNAEKSWGANLDGSPIIAVDDPQERATIFMVLVGQWSDTSAAPE